ncbi:hypothetical protein GOODEAATRI_012234 [Goodea atripinnis]|uniref:Uncharacterized protein n=1 Tax=Goodea atripinnis TaxID=208336 RepID=A0ABV0NTW1_9TELE
MYCAYTIPGMTGSSLMYYYNGKAVRKAASSLSSCLVFPDFCSDGYKEPMTLTLTGSSNSIQTPKQAVPAQPPGLFVFPYLLSFSVFVSPSRGHGFGDATGPLHGSSALFGGWLLDGTLCRRS